MTVKHGSSPVKNADSAKQQRKRPSSCTKCNATFSRVDHLARHVKSHDMGKQYRCPCGSQFSRNDVLARHMRQCPQGQQEPDAPQQRPKQTRSKKACNRCARSKLKCDSQKPCNSCRLKSQDCEYTREGYADPYGSFLVEKDEKNSDNSTEQPNEQEAPVMATPSNTESSHDGDVMNMDSVADDILFPLDFTPPNDESLSSQLCHELTNDGLWDSPIAPADWLSPSTQMSLLPPPTTNDQQVLQPIQAACEFDGQIYFDENLDFETMIGVSHLPNLPIYPQTGSFFDAEPLLASDGFLLRQLDPVEAKCVELRHLVQTSLDGATDANFVTRQNLIQCTELFAKHFSPNVPVLHLPTFNLVETPPILLLTIMLVGACYTPQISASTVHDYAIRLLNLIENQPHERDMARPPLHIIQASVMLCSVLVCSHDEKAFKFVTMYHARNLSMAERAGLFEAAEAVDFMGQTEETFDWHQWIERETRRRLGCQIFCHDVGRCIFMKRRPSLDPLAVPVVLPCYQNCWRASTPSACLRYLQQQPRQLKLPEAVSQIRRDNMTDASFLQTSNIGMFVIIIALHGLVFQAMQDEDNSFVNEAHDYSASPYKMASSTLNLQGSVLSSTANEMISKYGSEMVKKINKALDTWRLHWDLRGPDDVDQEHCTFTGDPLRFWWLAKLYLLNGARQRKFLEDAEPDPIVPTRANDAQQRLSFQGKILSWLIQCRSGGSQLEPLAQGSFLCRIMKRSEI